MVELVIFDADGVLFESEESNIAYYNAVLAAVGEPPLTPEESRRCIFLSASQVFESRARGVDQRLRRMREASSQLDFTPFLRLLKPSLELRPFLLTLRNDFKLGLATNRSATVSAMLEHLDLNDVFHAVTSCADDVRPKPAPDMLHLCVERANVEPNNALYVGDSEVDQIAAQAAGLRFLGVGTRVTCENRVASLAEVPAALSRLLAR
jgi:HAD superfamily hydrolase (TIGR01509 family)